MNARLGPPVLLWARSLIHAGQRRGELPRYGDETWLRLDDRDPRKVAACVVAAEAWRTDGLDTECRLQTELESTRAHDEAVDAEIEQRAIRIVSQAARRLG
ncbi:MAG: hypothetical protein ACM4D3_24730 [Candidatus Sericytochromatia bacterium]